MTEFSLITERLRLRDFVSGDSPALHAWQNHPAFLEHYPYDHWPEKATRELLDRFVAWASEAPRLKYQLAVVTCHDDALIGTVGIRRAATGDVTADIGYAFDPASWGKGYATEAVTALLDFAARDLHLETVEAIVVATNRRSIRLVERLGFREDERIPPGIGKDGSAWPGRIRFTRPVRP